MTRSKPPKEGEGVKEGRLPGESCADIEFDFRVVVRAEELGGRGHRSFFGGWSGGERV